MSGEGASGSAYQNPPASIRVDAIGPCREEDVAHGRPQGPVRPGELVVAEIAAAFAHHVDVDVVLQVPPDAGQVVDRIDAERLQRVAGADAGEHEQLGGADGPGADQHLAGGAHVPAPPAAAVVDADRAAVLDDHAGRHRAGFHRQVGARHRGPQEGIHAAAAPGVAVGCLVVAAAFLGLAVEVGVEGQPRLLCRAQECRRYRQGADGVAYAERAAGRVVAVVEALVVLRPLEVGQHVGIGPAGAAGRGPGVVIPGVAAGIDHGVDRAAAAQHPALRIPHRAVADLALGRRGIAPRVGRAGQLGESGRHADVGVPVPATRFQQQDGHVGVLAESRCQAASRRARAHDDVVVGAHGQSRWMERPPSTWTTVPVAKAKSPRTSAAVARATSTGSPHRGIGLTPSAISRS